MDTAPELRAAAHAPLARARARVRLTRWMQAWRWLPVLAGLWALLGAGAARAQFIDDVELRREGADAVLQIRFVAPVQVLRALTAGVSDQSLVFYRLQPTNLTLQGVAPVRRLQPPAWSALPVITIADEGSEGRNGDERRLVVRFGTPVSHHARASRDPRRIEIVLDGMGGQVTPTPLADEPAAPGAALRVTLESTTQAGSMLSAPVPAALQHVNVFTSQRVVEGRVLYETHLGPFASQAEAESVLRVALGRFPKAVVTSDAAPGAPAAPAAPAPPVAPAAPAASVAPVASTASTAPAAPTAPASPAAPASPNAPATAHLPVASATAAAPAAAASQASAAVPSPPMTPGGAAATAAAVAQAAPTDLELEQEAAALLSSAREAMASGAVNSAIETLSRLLDRPPNRSSRAAQALIGHARVQTGDVGRARAEFDAFLRLYPVGADSDAVRAALAALAPPPSRGTSSGGRAESTTTLVGSVSSFYYGGQSRIRTQEFEESAIGGLPQLVSDATLSDTDQSQLVSAVDVHWRHRDADVDRRFVFRDNHSQDFNRPDKTRNRLSALYFDQRSFTNGTHFRLGRQSPLGGGVLGRFDGLQADYAFRPRWKAGVVLGVPSDALLDTRRHFYGVSVDAQALTPQLGGALYAIEQKIDGQTDRRAVGTELRYFDGGLSLSSQLDYDVSLKGLNIATLQGTWQRSDNTVFSALFDRRKTPLLMLGNALFFGGLIQPPPTRLSDLLDSGQSLTTLRQQVRDTTANSIQAALGVSTPLTAHWQMGVDLRYTNTEAIAPVPDLLPQGQPSSGDIYNLSLQFIGTNLYSARDTHVFIANVISAPAFQGQLLSYNHSSLVWQRLQLEPSIRVYRQTGNDNVRSTRWSPGLRLSYRLRPEMTLESEASIESSKTTSPARNESSTRTFYYLGGRFDF